MIFLKYHFPWFHFCLSHYFLIKVTNFYGIFIIASFQLVVQEKTQPGWIVHPQDLIINYGDEFTIESDGEQFTIKEIREMLSENLLSIFKSIYSSHATKQKMCFSP